MHEWIFTFGYGQRLENCFVRVKADSYVEAREKMVATYGSLWAFQYDSEEAAAVARFNLREVPFGEPNAKGGSMNKEEVYDKEIYPLMNQILEICEQNSIVMVASFAIPTESKPDLVCNSAYHDKNGKMSPRMALAMWLLMADIAHINVDETETTSDEN